MFRAGNLQNLKPITRSVPGLMPGELACMFDLYHGDPLGGASYADDVPLFNAAAAAGWAFLLHKLSQGSGFPDPLAVGRLQAAQHSNLLGLGGYHYMTTTDPVEAQVALFHYVRGRVGFPLVNVLDFEPKAATTAAEEMADVFCNAVFATTGVRPMLYTGRWNVTPQPVGNLPACPLLLAEYGTDPVFPWPGIQYVARQYSDGKANNPVSIPCVGKVDQSAFMMASLDDVEAWWGQNAV